MSDFDWKVIYILIGVGVAFIISLVITWFLSRRAEQ